MFGMTDFIAAKRDGREHSREELAAFIGGYVRGEIPDYQASAWLMAVYLRGMTDRETTDLTMIMADSGERYDLSDIEHLKADKHSTGGVGDKTTFIALPCAAACGVYSAKLSGRGLGHTGGTIDKLEAIPGYNTEPDFEHFADTVRRAGMCVASATASLAPADKLLYALRDVTATVGSLPLIASSIMSKKLAGGSDAIVLDVKTGSGALMKTFDDSLALVRAMTVIGNMAGKPTAALITDMNDPLGRFAGNAPEVSEALAILRGDREALEAAPDLREVSLALAAKMVELSGIADGNSASRMAREVLDSGRAYEVFEKMITLQGGRLDEFEASLADGISRRVIWNGAEGYVVSVDTETAGNACVALGAGRRRKGDSIDPLAGIEFLRKTGEYVKRGDVIARLICSEYGRERLPYAEELLISAYTVGEEKPSPRKMVYGCIGTDGEFREI